MNRPALDIETVMEEIRKAAAAQPVFEPTVEFTPERPELYVPENAQGAKTQEAINRCVLSRGILSERPLGGLKGFVKHILRKLMRFYIVPIVEDQNRFNENVVDTLVCLRDYTHATANESVQVVGQTVNTASAQLEVLSEKLKNEFAALQQENAALRARLDALEQNAAAKRGE